MVDLPHEVVDWAGLPKYDDEKTDDPYFNQGDPMLYVKDDEGTSGMKNVSTLNDSGYSFSTIADLIEQQL
jgi:hypothetical protein